MSKERVVIIKGPVVGDELSGASNQGMNCALESQFFGSPL